MKKIILLTVSLLASFIFHLSSVTAQQVTSAMFGMMEARSLGPGTMSGRITAIEGVNNDEGKTIYVGTAGGGVWKSTNAGSSYKPMFDKYCQSIGALAINQKNPSTVYVATGESNMRNSVSIGNGIYKTTDGGDNWKKIGLDSTEHISKVVLNPENPDIIYVAAPGPLWSNSKHRGVYKSTNGGDTWEKIFYIDEKTGCADLLIDPTNPNILFCSMWEFRRKPYEFSSGGNTSGLYKSIDGGKTWKEITKGLPSKPFGRIAMTLAACDPKQMLAIVESNKTGLYISSDEGESWKNQSATMNTCARPFYFSTIAFDPKDAKKVYRPAFQFAYSSDGGYSFTEASNDGGWVHSDMHAIWINPAHTNIIYVGSDGGIYRSIDHGASWQLLTGISSFSSMVIDPTHPRSLYAANGGVWHSGDGGAHWSALGGAGLPTGASVTVLAMDPKVPAVLYAGLAHQGLWRSVDGGASWWPDGLGPWSPRSIAIDPVATSTLYVGVTGGGLFKSTSP